MIEELIKSKKKLKINNENRSFKLIQNKSNPNFILVDTKKQIRGIYDGTEENEISRLIEDIYVLANK